jgi:hypothetical protein
VLPKDVPFIRGKIKGIGTSDLSDFSFARLIHIEKISQIGKAVFECRKLIAARSVAGFRSILRPEMGEEKKISVHDMSVPYSKSRILLSVPL